MALQIPKQRRQFDGMLRAAVELVDERVLKHHPPARFLHIFPHGGHDLAQRPAPGDGHDLPPDLVVGGVQGQAQRNAQIFLCQAANLIRQAAGADGYIAQA